MTPLILGSLPAKSMLLQFHEPRLQVELSKLADSRRKRLASTGFLLRFQETVQQTPSIEAMAKTKTAVQREKPDEGRVVPLAGTQTPTEVKRETADADPKSRSFYSLPR